VRARDKSYAKRELEVLADELNAGVEIDWSNTNQIKYFIGYAAADIPYLGIHKRLYVDGTNLNRLQDNIYCLSKDFLEVALEKLGEEKLRLILGVA
jgi:hypothetical protein